MWGACGGLDRGVPEWRGGGGGGGGGGRSQERLGRGGQKRSEIPCVIALRLLQAVRACSRRLSSGEYSTVEAVRLVNSNAGHQIVQLNEYKYQECPVSGMNCTRWRSGNPNELCWRRRGCVGFRV